MKRQDWETCNMVAQAIAFNWNAQASQLPTPARDTTKTDSLTCSQGAAVAQPVAFRDTADCLTAAYGTKWNGNASADNGSLFAAQPIAPSLTASNDPSRSPQSSEVTQQVTAVYDAIMQVRRLTPVECERLQGFPDNYTNIPWRKQSTAPDGPRYKALGNSMAVPCMRWIGQRIQDNDPVA